MYSLVYDADAGFIRMTVKGFWTVAMVEAIVNGPRYHTPEEHQPTRGI